MLQSLFFWQLYCNLQTWHVQRTGKNLVTILVFLAALLQRNLLLGVCRTALCYNPCFSGSSIATLKRVLPLYGFNELQSLFFWQLYCNLSMIFSTGNEGYFVTILVFLAALLQLTKRSKSRQNAKLRYNPCFSGSSIATLKIFSDESNRLRFSLQSLFFWQLYCNLRQ